MSKRKRHSWTNENVCICCGTIRISTYNENLGYYTVSYQSSKGGIPMISAPQCNDAQLELFSISQFGESFIQNE